MQIGEFNWTGDQDMEDVSNNFILKNDALFFLWWFITVQFELLYNNSSLTVLGKLNVFI